MKNHDNNDLREELKLGGASDSEANELAAIAGSLHRLKGSRSSSQSASHAQRSSVWTKLLVIGVPSVAGLAIGMVLVILSQTVLPGSMLYPVQKLSDSVAVSANPDYRGVVMMKRAQEVKQLIAEHAHSNIVLATLADYRNEASVYKSAPANYAAFEYCKTNLQQAAAMAPSVERRAINATLSSLNDV